MVENQSPKVPFHPAPSVRHEIGIMMGFIAFFALAMSLYLVLWKVYNKRGAEKERQRREALAQRGFGGEKSRNEKAGASVSS